jgi:hypothetical protein
MEIKAAIQSKDGVWRAKIDTLGIDIEIVPLAYDLSDLPDVLAKIENEIREKTRADLSTTAELCIVQTDLKFTVAYSVRSPRDRTLGDFDVEVSTETDEAGPLELEGQEVLLITGAEVDVDALIAEFDEAFKAVNGGEIYAVLHNDVMCLPGTIVRERLEAGEITVDCIREEIARLRREAEGCPAAEAVDGE